MARPGERARRFLPCGGLAKRCRAADEPSGAIAPAADRGLVSSGPVRRMIEEGREEIREGRYVTQERIEQDLVSVDRVATSATPGRSGVSRR